MIVKTNFKKWKWKFSKKHTFYLPFSVGEKPLVILSGSGNELVVAQLRTLTIKRHYHFDGATCAPDFKRVLLASALHDSLLQLCDKYPKIIGEHQAHLAFKEEMKRQGFKLWPIYFWAVNGIPRKIYKQLTKVKK